MITRSEVLRYRFLVEGGVGAALLPSSITNSMPSLPMHCFSAAEISGSRKVIPTQETDNGVVVFKTVKNGHYLVGDADFEGTLVEIPHFTGEKNLEPKHFREAILGKERDF